MQITVSVQRDITINFPIIQLYHRREEIARNGKRLPRTGRSALAGTGNC